MLKVRVGQDQVASVVVGKVDKEALEELLRDRHAPSVEATALLESFERFLHTFGVGMRPAVGAREEGNAEATLLGAGGLG
jgi:hypothetical protein